LPKLDRPAIAGRAQARAVHLHVPRLPISHLMPSVLPCIGYNGKVPAMCCCTVGLYKAISAAAQAAFAADGNDFAQRGPFDPGDSR